METTDFLNRFMYTIMENLFKDITAYIILVSYFIFPNLTISITYIEINRVVGRYLYIVYKCCRFCFYNNIITSIYYQTKYFRIINESVILNMLYLNICKQYSMRNISYFYRNLPLRKYATTLMKL